MKVITHLCMPEGEAMRRRFARFMNEVKDDNQAVIRAMLEADMPVPDTVGEMGLSYVPAQQRVGPDGDPIWEIRGMRALIEHGSFSCGCAAAYEAAVMEEKYGIPTRCISVPQGGDDSHGVFVTPERVIDPTANFLSGRRDVVKPRPVANPKACFIGEDGRVTCDEPPECYVDENGVWSCPIIPGLSNRRAKIKSIHGEPGAQWARTDTGAVVPVHTRRRRR